MERERKTVFFWQVKIGYDLVATVELHFELGRAC